MQCQLISVIHVVLGNERHEALVVISVMDEGHLDGELSQFLTAVCARVE